MASGDDIIRARAGVRRSLARLEQVSRFQDDCEDAPLRMVLEDINRRQLDQASRLLDWLAERGEFRRENPSPAGNPVETSAEPFPVQQDDPPTRGSSAATRPASSRDGVAVTERREVTPELLVLKAPRPLDFDFLPGQSVKVGVEGIRRSYSIVSAPHEPELEFFIELFPGGDMSERLRRLTTGDRLTLDRPKGSFLFDERFTEHLMLATVTGVNPFISIIRDYLHRGRTGHRFHLLHGASYQNEFGYRHELEAVAAAHPDLLTYLPTVSRPDETANAGWVGSTGRVDSLIEDYLEQTGLQSDATLVYACGHSGMIGEVERCCRPRGFRIETEDYD